MRKRRKSQYEVEQQLKRKARLRWMQRVRGALTTINGMCDDMTAQIGSKTYNDGGGFRVPEKARVFILEARHALARAAFQV